MMFDKKIKNMLSSNKHITPYNKLGRTKNSTHFFNTKKIIRTNKVFKNLWSDSDKDGVRNFNDCVVNNSKRQGPWHKYVDKEQELRDKEQRIRDWERGEGRSSIENSRENNKTFSIMSPKKKRDLERKFGPGRVRRFRVESEDGIRIGDSVRPLSSNEVLNYLKSPMYNGDDSYLLEQNVSPAQIAEAKRKIHSYGQRITRDW